MLAESEIVVRTRTGADIPGCLRLMRAVHEADAYPSAWPEDPAAFLAPHGFLEAWIALRGAEVAGHVVLRAGHDPALAALARSARRPEASLGEVKRLFVHPQARGAGIPGALLAAAVAAARSRGLHPVLETVADNAAAIRCYERNGWRRFGSGAATWQLAGGERPLLHYYEVPS